MAAVAEARTFTRIKRKATYNICGEALDIHKVVTVTVKAGEEVIWEREVSPKFKIDQTCFSNPLFGWQVRRARHQGRREAVKHNVHRAFGISR